MNIELIANTLDAAALQRLRAWVSDLRVQGHRVSARATFERGDALRFAREAVERRADLVVSAGGDGTLNEVVNGLLSSPERRPLGEVPRLAIVPLGTGNDFASFLGIPLELEEALTAAMEGRELEADVAMVNDRYFLNVSSGGLGAEATEETSDRAKRLLGAAAYFVTGVRTFATLDPSHGRFTGDGEVLFDGPFFFFAVGNGGRAGGGNWITPHASVGDAALDVCVVEAMSRTELLRILPEIRAGNHVNREHVTYRRVKTLTIEPAGPFCVNVDGEPLDAAILNYSIVPAALRLVAGKDEP